tara:strand:- start:2308 stop:3771 length:1464 start_codon:yes stop_codon:yes gene_type:complete
MPKYKFGPNDLFNSTLKTYPRYDVTFYQNEAYINNQISQGNLVPSGSISLYELNVDRQLIADNLAYGFITKNENPENITFVTDASSSKSKYDLISAAADLPSNFNKPSGYTQVGQGADIYLAYPLSSSITREFLVGAGSSAPYSSFELSGSVWGTGLAFSGSVRRMLALESVIDYYRPMSPFFDYNKYYISGTADAAFPQRYFNSINGTSANPSNADKDGSIELAAAPYQKYMTLFQVPYIYRGTKIKPGSVELNFYVTGTLIATAKDSRQNGELIETYGPSDSSTIGVVMYNEGMLLVTGNYSLSDEVSDGYLCPIETPNPTTLRAGFKDNPRWVHFGAYDSYIKKTDSEISQSFSAVSSSYTLSFQGTNPINTLTMFAHANKNELNWSNNPTFIQRSGLVSGSDYQKTFVKQTSSVAYIEDNKVSLANTVSGNFANYSSSYQDQTYISKINVYDDEHNLVGIAKLATPIKKTNAQDYTFKLKIDL